MRFLTRAAIIRDGISRRARGQCRIVGRPGTGGKDGRIVVDVAAIAIGLRCLALDHQRACIDVWPVVGPSLGDNQHEVPAQCAGTFGSVLLRGGLRLYIAHLGQLRIDVVRKLEQYLPVDRA